MSTAADFVAYAERRDQRARERLVRTFLPLTVSIARHYQRIGADERGYAAAEASAMAEDLLCVLGPRAPRDPPALPPRPDAGRDRAAQRLLADARLAEEAGSDDGERPLVRSLD